MAAGFDGIEAEHILHAHSVLVYLSKVLFNGILQYGYVPHAWI